ncbi:fatty acid--CoA ligase FadD11 [Nocardia sp. NPDC055321]
MGGATMPERPSTLCSAFQQTAATDPSAIAVRTPGDAQSLTWLEYSRQVRQVATAMSGLGLGRGDTVALMMANRVEFYPLEIGAQHIGATSFSVYNTLAPEQLAHVFANAGNRMVVCEAQYVDKVRASGAAIEWIVVLDGAIEGTLTVEQFLGHADPAYDFEAGWRAVQPDDVATLIYTSGTTGNPKGVETTHENLLAEAYAFGSIFDVRFGDRITSFMPSAHIADRFTALYLHEVYGTQITAVADAKQIAAALTDVRPTIWGAVPRVWEKLKAAIELAVDKEPDPDRRHALRWALSVAAQRATAELAGEPMSESLRQEWEIADAAVLSQLRANLGLEQLRWALSGAAPIPPETLGFFAGLGIPIAEIWGMSELSCVASASHPRDTKLGTVGRMLPGMEHRLADDGELLVRGPLVMKGYRNEPEKTAEAIDADGWLHTGDVFTVDEDGFLRIVDRKKELIINSAGKNMSPANIENVIKAATPLIGAMAVIGDARVFNTALIVLDAEIAPARALARGLTDTSALALTTDPEVIAEIATGITAGNQRLARVEQIKRFIVLPTFWEPGGEELTLTMKLRRRVIDAKYLAEIEQMYRQRPEPSVHVVAIANGTVPAES